MEEELTSLGIDMWEVRNRNKYDYGFQLESDGECGRRVTFRKKEVFNKLSLRYLWDSHFEMSLLDSWEHIC